MALDIHPGSDTVKAINKQRNVHNKAPSIENMEVFESPENGQKVLNFNNIPLNHVNVVREKVQGGNRRIKLIPIIIVCIIVRIVMWFLHRAF